MNNQWYFEVGEAPFEVVLAGIMSSYVPHVSTSARPALRPRPRTAAPRKSILPTAEFHACDLDTDGIKYCEQSVSALRRSYRMPTLPKSTSEREYDLIWVGSLFTHVDKPQAAAGSRTSRRFLTPTGIIVATMHGRWSESVHERMAYLGEDRWSIIMEGYRDRVRIQRLRLGRVDAYVPGNYGISLARPHRAQNDRGDRWGTHLLLQRAGLGRPPGRHCPRQAGHRCALGLKWTPMDFPE